MPLSSARTCHVVPSLSAIALRVSPALTVYLVGRALRAGSGPDGTGLGSRSDGTSVRAGAPDGDAEGAAGDGAMVSVANAVADGLGGPVTWPDEGVPSGPAADRRAMISPANATASSAIRPP